ncbi:MAG: cation:proton antiporter, partial [Candidatus Bathyarchaeota archaeon]
MELISWEMTIPGQFDAIYNILIVVTLVILITRQFRFPSSIAFILAGIISTIYSPLPLPSLGPEVFMLLLLPPIIFQDALHLDVGDLIEDSDSIMAYAFAGTLVMLASVATFLYVFMRFTIVEAILLGIIISPTDPVAVINTFHNLGVNKRFEILVTGESLFNDGIAIAIYSVVVSLITLGSISLFGIAKIGMVAIIGGTFLGLLFGYVAHQFFCWTEDKFAEVLVSFIVAFGVFQLSESLGASGVIAVVVLGLIINYRTRRYGGMGRESVEMLEALWEFVGFLASSIAFIFIGMNLNLTVLLANLYP